MDKSTKNFDRIGGHTYHKCTDRICIVCGDRKADYSTGNSIIQIGYCEECKNEFKDAWNVFVKPEHQFRFSQLDEEKERKEFYSKLKLKK